jgi:hypothetical protein
VEGMVGSIHIEWLCVAKRNYVLFDNGPVRCEIFRGLMLLKILCLFVWNGWNWAIRPEMNNIRVKFPKCSSPWTELEGASNSANFYAYFEIAVIIKTSKRNTD